MARANDRALIEAQDQISAIDSQFLIKRRPLDQILILNPYSTYRAHRRQHSVVPSVSYGDFSESQLAGRVDAHLRAPTAALATSSSTNAGRPELEGTRKLPPSAGANPSLLAPRAAATDEE